MRKVFSVNLGTKKRFLRLFGSSGRHKGLAAGLVNLEPGESVGLHNTKEREEALIIIEGSAKILYGKKDFRLAKQGSFVYIPPKKDHNVKNIGKKPLKYVYLTAKP